MNSKVRYYNVRSSINLALGISFVFFFYGLCSCRKEKLGSRHKDLINTEKQSVSLVGSNLQFPCTTPSDTEIKKELLKWRKLAGKFQCQLDPNGEGVTGGWCLQASGDKWGPDARGNKAARHHVPADPGIANAFVKFLKNFYDSNNQNNKLSLLDIGAGVGQYGYWFESNGANKWLDWSGFDGAENVEEFTNSYVKWLDVTNPYFDIIGNDYRADWIMSLEVAEHIPSESTSAMLNLLDKHTKHGIILSWAPPGQGGHSHINEKSNEEVVQLMKKRGFVQDKWCLEFQEYSRNAAIHQWFKNSLMVFIREIQSKNQNS